MRFVCFVGKRVFALGAGPAPAYGALPAAPQALAPAMRPDVPFNGPAYPNARPGVGVGVGGGPGATGSAPTDSNAKGSTTTATSASSADAAVPPSHSSSHAASSQGDANGVQSRQPGGSPVSAKGTQRSAPSGAADSRPPRRLVRIFDCPVSVGLCCTDELSQSVPSALSARHLPASLSLQHRKYHVI